MRTPQRADADQRRKRFQDSERCRSLFLLSQAQDTARPSNPRLQDSQDYYQDTKTGRCRRILPEIRLQMFAVDWSTVLCVQQSRQCQPC